jgi:hypothetical protein
VQVALRTQKLLTQQCKIKTAKSAILNIGIGFHGMKRLSLHMQLSAV